MYEESKKAAGYRAATLIEPSTIVGLGTGSTVKFFIEKLIKLYQSGLDIKVCSSSDASTRLAKMGNLPLIQPQNIDSVDITVDGADEIDAQNQMIKGGGGALLREKILHYASRKTVIIVDESKCVDTLGKVPVPVEVIPFALPSILRAIQSLQLSGTLRMKSNAPYITDHKNYIYDLTLHSPLVDPGLLHRQLINIPGVVETGIFCNKIDLVIIGNKQGDTFTRP